MGECNMCFAKDLVNVIKEDYDIPKYKCEVVVDTLLSMFRVEDIVNKCGFDGKEEGIKFVAKEFPFKREDSSKSFNIDYILINEDKKTLYLVELKTTKAISKKQMERYLKVIQKIKDKKSAEFLMDDFNKIKEDSIQKKKYQNYEDKYLKELNDKNAFKEVYNVELIYISPKSEKAINLFKEKNIKNITFENLYKDMEFNTEDENAKWNDIKDIFEYIDANS
jgi:hypothetical protein